MGRPTFPLSHHVLLLRVPPALWVRRPCEPPALLLTCRDLCDGAGAVSPRPFLPRRLTPCFMSRCAVTSPPRSVPKSRVTSSRPRSERRRTRSDVPARSLLATLWLLGQHIGLFLLV